MDEHTQFEWLYAFKKKEAVITLLVTLPSGEKYGTAGKVLDITEKMPDSGESTFEFCKKKILEGVLCSGILG